MDWFRHSSQTRNECEVESILAPFWYFWWQKYPKLPKAHKLAIDWIQDHTSFIPLKQYVLSDSRFRIARQKKVVLIFCWDMFLYTKCVHFSLGLSNMCSVSLTYSVDASQFFQKLVKKWLYFCRVLLYLKIKERFFKKLLTGGFFSLYYASSFLQLSSRGDYTALLHNQYIKKVRFPCIFGTLNVE